MTIEKVFTTNEIKAEYLDYYAGHYTDAEAIAEFRRKRAIEPKRGWRLGNMIFFDASELVKANG